MRHALFALMLALAACSKAPPGPAAPAAAAAWPDARALKVAVTTPTPERSERLELRHEPGADATRAHLKLVLLLPEGERTLFDELVPLAQRDALWGARWMLFAEPAPGRRRAISWDGGATFAVVLALAGDALVFCPHKKVESLSGTPDWPKLFTPERWATGVFETAVWGCDEAGAHCRSSSQAGMTVHHSEAEAEPLAVAHQAELHAALAALDSLAVDRFMGAGLLDAAVTFQGGLGADELEKLGKAAAKALSSSGPFTADERRTLRLRVVMARAEAAKTPKDQLSPRASIAALGQALEELPQAIPTTGK